MANYTDTINGQNLYLAFEQVRNGYQTGLPGHTDQLRSLAQRPIGG
jgi:hypothetical protein